MDVITAHSDIPGRESAAILLRDATHSLLSWGWGNDEGSEEDDFFEPSDLDDEDSDGYDEDTLPVRAN